MVFEFCFVIGLLVHLYYEMDARTYIYFFILRFGDWQLLLLMILSVSFVSCPNCRSFGDIVAFFAASLTHLGP